MTSRRSSGSMRAESAVEPTKSENITVTWRRSASVRGAGVVISGEMGVCPVLSAATALNSLSRAPSGRPSIAQVLIGEVTKHIGIDRIVAKRLRVLLQTDPAEPTVDVQVQSPGSCQRQFLKRVESGRPAVIPRGFLNQPGTRHVDANHSTAA